MPVSTTTTFIPDDDNGRLFALCTDEQWEEYLPVIEQLESTMSGEEPFVRLKLEHLNPDEAIETLGALFAGRSGQRYSPLHFSPVGSDILVVAANESDIQGIEAVLAEIDVPTEIERRTFDIHHIDPGELVTLIHALVGDETATPSNRSPRGRPQSRCTTPLVAPGVDDLTIVQMGSQLIVETTPAKIARVAALIEELDISQEEIGLRVYDDFPPHVDVEEIAETVSAVVNGTVLDARAKRRRRTPQPPRVTLIPQPESRRLIVRGDPTVFSEVEGLLSALTDEGQLDGVQGLPDPIFVDVEHAEPAELIEMIRPLLDLHVQELIAAGQLDDEPIRSVPRTRRGGRRGSAASDESPHYYIAPDVGRHRIILAGAQVLLDEAALLIEQFDLPSDAERMIVRTVELSHVDPATVMATIGDIIGAAHRGGVRRRSQRSVTAGKITKGSLTINAPPGGSGIVVYGLSNEVEQALALIEQVRELSSSGRQINVYQIEHADVENLADFILNVVDSPKPKRRRPRSRRAAHQPPQEEGHRTSRIWLGQEVYIRADLIDRTLIVAGSPSTLAEIDEIISQFDAEDAIATLEDPEIPTLLYELKHVDAFDAAFDLELFLDTVWEPSNEIPTVDVAPLGDTLIIRYPDEDRFPLIEELISAHIDIPDPNGDRVIRRSFMVPRGMTAQEAVEWIRQNHPEFEIEVEGRLKARDYGVERVRPQGRKKR